MPQELNPYGGRYVAAIFRVKPPSNGSQVVISTQVASLFLLNPGGDNVSPHLSFKDLKAWQDDKDPHLIHCSGLITNEGNLHVSADQLYGFIQITDDDGYIVGQMMWEPHTMLPGNSYTEEQTWQAPDTLPTGTYYFHLTAIAYQPNGKEQRYTGTCTLWIYNPG